MIANIVLFDGFDLLDVVAPYEVLYAGGQLAGGQLRVELVSLEGARAVPSGPSGVTLQASGGIDLARAQVLVLPGAAGPASGEGDDTIPAILGRQAQGGLATVLREALQTKATTVATVCGGSLVLGLAGLLEGRPAVTHPLGMEILGATGAKPVHARIVDDGNLVSAGGVTSGLDLGVYLLERHLGPRIAHAVEQLFAYERRGTVWRAAGPEAVAP